ncbi:hypothetical protein SLA2020_224240 [Shorea laevis]
MAWWVNRTIKNRLWGILDKAAKENRAVDLQDLLLRLTFDNICGLTFGKDPERLSPELPENRFAIAFDTATEATLYRFLYPGFQWRLEKILEIGTEKNLKQSLEIVDNYMNDAVAARKENCYRQSVSELCSVTDCIEPRPCRTQHFLSSPKLVRLARDEPSGDREEDYL